MYYLIKSNYDCADEFDVPGCVLMSSDQWSFFRAVVTKAFAVYDGAIEWYVGTNEYVVFESARQVLDPLNITWLDNKDEIATIQKYFGDSFGQFPDMDYFIERIPEDDFKLLAESYAEFSSVYNIFKEYLPEEETEEGDHVR